MDEKKAQKLKILVLVVLGGLCVGLAVPKLLNTGPKATPGKAVKNGKPIAAKPGAAATQGNPTNKGDEGHATQASPKVDKFPVDVGPEIVKDPFSPSFLEGAGLEQPPANNQTPGGGEHPGGSHFPWEGSPGNNLRPPVLVSDGGGLGHVGLPNANGGDTPPQVNKGPAFQITGVIRGESTIAIIRSDTARYYAKVGDSLGGGYSVKSISGDRVTLSGPSGTQVLFVGRS